MIVTGVCVEGFRCFVQPTEVRGFSEGLTIVSAPNGTGKSTLFEAIRRALIDHHTVSGGEAARMRPWGRTVTPKITVEFTHGGARWKIHKRFLDAPDCELSRWERDVFAPVHRGERADEYVRQLLSQPTAPRGLAKETHWGVAQVLWAPQGALELGPLSTELATRVRDTLAKELVSDRGAAIERAVEQRYLDFYTPNTGKLRGGKAASPLVRAEEQLAQAREALALARAHHERTTQAQDRVAALQRDLHRAVRAREEHELRVDALAGALRNYDEAERQRVAAEGRVRETESALRVATARRDTWRLARAQRSTRERDLQEALGAVAQAEGAHASAVVEADRLARAEPVAREAHEALAACEAACRRAEQLRSLRASVARDEESLEALTVWEVTLATHTAALAGLAAPDAQEVEGARAERARMEQAEARLDALSIEVELRAERPLEGASGQGSWRILSGEKQVFRAVAGIEFTIDGVGALAVRGPVSADEVARAEAQRERSRAALAACAARWGTSDPSALEALRAARAEREAAVREARARLDGLGGAGASAALAARIQRSRADFAAHGDAPTDLDALSRERDALRAQAAEAGDPRALAKASREAERTRAERASQLAVACERSRLQRASLEEASSRWALLGAEGDTEAAANESRERALLAYDAALAAAERARKSVASRVEVEQALAQARAERSRAEDAAVALRDALRQEEGQLKEQLRNGHFTALARAEEEHARVLADRERARGDAESVRLLRETLTRCRAEASARVVGGVERAAESILARIVGVETTRIALGEGFALSGARPGEAERPELERLSGGEREQVHFAVRLALAEVLAREERPMVVLDDVFVATDRARFARVLEVLVDASARMQVVVLTCHPERYESLGAAARIDLGALRADR
jgi:energy-coupling factor transporter ATP-binding protein EcfA2